MEASPAFAAWAALFCRISLGLVFAFSAGGKALELQAFGKTVAGFGILPHRLSRPAAYLFVASEAAAAILLAAGGKWSSAGFGLGASLLLAFSAALAVALWRRLQIPCNCFGSARALISGYDLWRNAGFAACAVVGWVASGTSGGQGDFVAWDVALVAMPALAFVTAWVNLADLAWVFQRSGPAPHGE